MNGGVSAKEVYDVAQFCVDALRARIAELEAERDRLRAEVEARDRVIEAAFEALNAWSGIVSYTSCGHLTAVARRLRAELEGK